MPMHSPGSSYFVLNFENFHWSTRTTSSNSFRFWAFQIQPNEQNMLNAL